MFAMLHKICIQRRITMHTISPGKKIFNLGDYKRKIKKLILESFCNDDGHDQTGL